MRFPATCRRVTLSRAGALVRSREAELSAEIRLIELYEPEFNAHQHPAPRAAEPENIAKGLD